MCNLWKQHQNSTIKTYCFVILVLSSTNAYVSTDDGSSNERNSTFNTRNDDYLELCRGEHQVKNRTSTMELFLVHINSLPGSDGCNLLILVPTIYSIELTTILHTSLTTGTDDLVICTKGIFHPKQLTTNPQILYLCDASYQDNYLYFKLQHEIVIQLQLVKSSNFSVPVCPHEVQHYSACQLHVARYDNIINCTIVDGYHSNFERIKDSRSNYPRWDKNITICDFKCCQDCQCTLEDQSLVTVFRNNSKSESLILYPLHSRKIYMENKGLRWLDASAFKSFNSSLRKLYLQHNNLTELPLKLFQGLNQLHILNLSYNSLSSLHSGLLYAQSNLRVLDLTNNNIAKLQSGVFTGLNLLQKLYLSTNRLNRCLANTFLDLSNLELLYLKANQLSQIDPGAFSGLIKLKLLSLMDNCLVVLTPGMFNGLWNLKVLNFWKNNISLIKENTFKGLNHLIALSFGYNNLTKVSSDIYDQFPMLTFLDLRNNSIAELPPNFFAKCPSIKVAVLTGNFLDLIRSNAFDGLNKSSHMMVDFESTCCFVHQAKCHPTHPPPVFLTCKRLLQDTFLRTVMWILGLCAVIGNSLVCTYRLMQHTAANRVQSFLIANLALSDMMLGIYMLILASVDLYYADLFPSYAYGWQKNPLCKFAGFLAILSSEASVFFITTISIDRFFGVKNPFGKHLGMKGTKRVVLLLWITAFAVSLLPTLILLKENSKVYDVSEVCVGLPLSIKEIRETNETVFEMDFNVTQADIIIYSSSVIDKEPGMYYSIVLFIGVNLFCFIIITFCYLHIFITVQKTSRAAGRTTRQKEEARMAIKMAVIVLTDFFCWMPLIFLSILVQFGQIVVSPNTYAWVVTFILPINSAVNPFLYTLTMTLSQYIRDRNKANSTKQRNDIKTHGSASSNAPHLLVNGNL